MDMDGMDSMMETQDILTQASARFLNALIENKGIEKIIDIGFELLGNPILVIVASYKVLAFTKNIEVDDPNWYLSHESNFLRYEYISNNEMKENFEEARKSKYPVLHKPKNRDFEVIHAAIVSDNKVIGFLIIPNHKKQFAENDMKIADLMKNVLALELQKNKFFRNSKGIMAEYFIADLLEGNIKDSKIIEERCRSLNWVLHGNNYVLTLKRKRNSKESSLSSINDLMNSMIVGGKSVIYNNLIVVIVSRKKRDFHKTYLKSLLEVLQKYEMVGGISCCFNSLVDISDHFEHSLMAVALGMKLDGTRIFYSYEKYFLHHLLSSCKVELNLKALCHPALFYLEEHEIRYSEDLIKCLYHYLRNGKNIVKAANAIGIHRNTMSYRIKKIEEIMGIDIDNEDMAYYLFCLLKIMGYIDKLKLHTD